ncbi:MAG: F0F1 ATP synthase subunit delta [Spirochaetaceae bacterium]|jgi:F-type H+-transporting ATPase subunit delta|nr:F0F1 ATP synthase subunit delta [Spirochaetaceae bacterium]
MFRAEGWADAFAGFAGKTGAEEALEFLRTLCRAVLSLPGYVSGQTDADALGGLIDRALERAGEKTAPALAARAFLLLMIRRNRFIHYKAILREIEKRINRDKGLVELFLDIPFQPGEALIEGVKQRALYLTGGKDPRLKIQIMPELIGGFRLRLGSRVFDGSLKTRLQQMAGDLGGKIYSRTDPIRSIHG